MSQHVTANHETKQDTCQEHGEFKNIYGFGRYLGCPKCAQALIDKQDREREQRHKVEFEQAQTDRAERAKKEKHAKMLKETGIPPRFINANFDDYRVNSDGQQAAKAAFMSIAKRFDAFAVSGSKLTILGSTGTGKTHLACALVSYLYKYGVAAHYVDANYIALEIRNSYASHSNQTELEILERYASYELLILDEVGGGKGTDGERHAISDVLSMRHNNNKPTIVISNMASAEFKKAVGDRIWSRLHEGGRFLVMSWDDYRIKR